jgi:hypothetical protein
MSIMKAHELLYLFNLIKSALDDKICILIGYGYLNKGAQKGLATPHFLI